MPEALSKLVRAGGKGPVASKVKRQSHAPAFLDSSYLSRTLFRIFQQIRKQSKSWVFQLDAISLSILNLRGLGLAFSLVLQINFQFLETF